MPSETKQDPATERPGIISETAALWNATPSRTALLALLLAWVALFHWLGNSTLGYVNTSSIFGWWENAMKNAPDEEHAWLMPFAVVALLWSRRDEYLKLEKGAWWPAFALLLAALLVHVSGYAIQQTRLSVIAFFMGTYAISGLMLGRRWMSLALFPFSLFLFCVPLGSNGVEIISFPLRLMATTITRVFCDSILGIKVIQNGTQLFDAGYSYQYEVAAACGGIRSLTAIVAFSVIYGYITYKTMWRRLAMVAMAFPLAVLANVFRLTLIILAAEAFGQSAGNYVHDSAIFSLAPYIPAIGGILLLGWWMREDQKPGKPAEPLLAGGMEQKS